MQNKRCSRCEEVKDVREFGKNESRKDGFSHYCRTCMKAKNAKWREENPEKVRAISAKWRKENHEKMKAQNAKWREENPEKEKARKAKWGKENPEKMKAPKYKWVKENPEKVIYSNVKQQLKKKICETPPPELVEVKILINKIKKELCKTSKN